LALTFPGIVLIDFEDGYLTAEELGVNVPLVRPTTEEEFFSILEYPKEFEKELHRVEGFEDYQVKSFGVDTLTSLQTFLLGRPFVPAHNGRDPVQGRGILGTQRNRVEPDEPSLEDFKSLNVKMRKTINLARAMSYNTILLAHAAPDKTPESPKGPNVRPEMVEFRGYPDLVGKLKYNAGGLADMYLYMDRIVRQRKPVFRMHTIPNGNWEAKTRLASRLEPTIEFPTYDTLRAAYDSVTKREVS
jgi:hypothetical protein